jgi:hypothetical protein
VSRREEEKKMQPPRHQGYQEKREEFGIRNNIFLGVLLILGVLVVAFFFS